MRSSSTICATARPPKRCASIERQGGEALAVAADVAEEGDVERLFAAIDERFGRLDVLVNNAGVLEAQTRLENIDAARLHRVFATNVTGSFLCAREAVKRLSTRHGGGGGSIVNVSSMASRLGSPNEYIDYAAAKGAIDSMTIGLAREVAAEGIRVNAVRPGLIDTEIHASGERPYRTPEGRHTARTRRHGGGSRAGDSLAGVGRSQLQHRHLHRCQRRPLACYAS